MSEVERVKLLDEAAVRLVQGYQARGCMAYVIRNDLDSNISVIGPALPVDVVTKFLHLGAETYDRQIEGHNFGPFN
jgi:hypothetical protein